MTTITEQEAIRVLREALEGLLRATAQITTEYPTGYDGDKAEAAAEDALAATALTKQAAPALSSIQMILHCPKCGLQHIDAPDERTEGWTNPPHRSHLCHGCGHIWRPADAPTEGVAAIQTRGKNDSAPAQPVAAPEPVALQDGWKLVVVNPEFDNLMYWLERTNDNGNLSFDLIEPWEAFDYNCVPSTAATPAQAAPDEVRPTFDTWLNREHPADHNGRRDGCRDASPTGLMRAAWDAALRTTSTNKGEAA
jgi:hypothetical protein